MKLVRDLDYRKLARGPWWRVWDRPKYKYELLKALEIHTRIVGEGLREGANGFVFLEFDGLLRICVGFHWDGASGPTWDTASTMRASAAHDAICQLTEEGVVPFEIFRAIGDVLLLDLMLEDGANLLRATYYLWAVRGYSKLRRAVRRFAKGAARG